MSRGSIDEWDLDDIAIGSANSRSLYNMPENAKHYDVKSSLQRRLSDSAIRPGSPARYSFYGSMVDFVERQASPPPPAQRRTLAAEAWTAPVPVQKEKEKKKEKEKEEVQKSQGSLGYSFGDEEDDVMNWALGVYQSVRVPSRNVASGQKRPSSVNRARSATEAAPAAKRSVANGSRPSSTAAYYSIEDVMTPDSRAKRQLAQNVAVVPGPDEVATSQPVPLMAAEVSWDSMPLILEGTPGSDAASTETVEMYRENRILTLAVAAQDDKEVELPEPLHLDPRKGVDTDKVALHPVKPLRDEAPLNISPAKDNKTYLSDEAFMIDYERSKVSQMSAVLDMLRLHCLTGHNTTLVVGNTQRCTSLAEECVVAELVRSVDEIVHSDEVFGNVMTVSAYAIQLDGTAYNLLPTTARDNEPQQAQLGKSLLFGVCIGNGSPIRVCDRNDAKYVAQSLQYNARSMGVDTYSNPNTMVWVQLVLKQTRKVKGTFGDGYPPEVFLSSFQILHVGSNYQLLHEAIQETPKSIWPLLESSFGGHGRTSFVGFMDQEDDQSDVKRTMEFVDFMRSITNRPPYSGSVRKFLRKAANVTDINQELHVPLSAKTVTADAQKLLSDASVDPAVYPLSTKQPWKPAATRQREAVLFVPRRDRHAAEDSRSIPSQTLSVHIPRPPSVAVARGNTDVYIRMPAAVMVREQNANLMEKVRQTLQHSSLSSKERQPTLRVTSSTRRPSSSGGDVAAANDSNYVRGLGRNGSSKLVGNNVVTKVSSAKTAATATAAAPANKTNSSGGGGSSEGMNDLAARLMKHAEESHEENTAAIEDDALHIKSTVLLLHPPDELARTEPNAMSLAMVDETSIFLTLPEEAAALAGASKCRFIVDEVRQVSAPEEANQLVQTFSSLRRLRDSFVYDQSNVVLLSAHFDAPGSPFVTQPVWSDYKETITELATLKTTRKEPTQITLFGGLLKGKTLMQDLAEAGMEDSDFEPVPCVVGASPLFGPVLNQARGVDVAGPGEVDAVIDSMLHFADDVAGSDDNMWIVLTCVQKTTYALDVNHLSIEAAKMGYLYDVTFSSFTVVCTRNTAQIFADAFNKDDTRYPISILRTAMGGPAQTTCLLSIEANQSNATTVLQGLLAQYKVCGLTSVKPRSGQVSTYVQDCRNVSHAARNRIMDEELDDAQCAVLAERSAKYENMAMEHEIYLRNKDCEGFIIYPITTDEGATSQPASATPAVNNSPKPNSRPNSRIPSRAGASSPDSRPGSRSVSRVSDGAARLLSCTINIDASSGGLMSFSPRPPDMASGIASHSVLLLGNVVDVTSSSATMGDDYVDVHTTNTQGDVWVESGFSAMQKTFHVDEVVTMNKPGAPAPKTATLETSDMLRSALSAFLCGSNASIVLQETTEAAEAGMSQGLLHYVTKCIMDFRSGDATFYLSAAFAGREGMIDLLKTDVTDQDMKPSEIGFSPLGGAVLREAKLWPQKSEAGAHAAVDSAFAADLTLESGEEPHLLIFTMWQQLRIEAENDICLSSFTIVIGRGNGMTISQFFRPDTPYVRLLNYVLAGPCFTVCITAVTNAEPDDGQSPVFKMLNYQTMKLCSLPGKTMKFNSYVDLLKYHKSRAATQKGALNEVRQQVQKAKGAQERAELEERAKDLENALRVTMSLIEDDKNFLTGKWKGDVAPIYYA